MIIDASNDTILPIIIRFNFTPSFSTVYSQSLIIYYYILSFKKSYFLKHSDMRVGGKEKYVIDIVLTKTPSKQNFCFEGDRENIRTEHFWVAYHNRKFLAKHHRQKYLVF